MAQNQEDADEVAQSVAETYLDLQLLRHALDYRIFRLLHAEVLLE